MKKVVAIDGISGAGKGTLAKALAKALDFTHLDTGALYRAVTLKALKNGFDEKNEKEITKMLTSTQIEQKKVKGVFQIFLDGKNLQNEDQLRSPEVSDMVAKIAKFSAVRDHIRKIQHEIAKKHNLVVEGRDVTTVVFPNAFAKFFVTVPLLTRAKRRQKEYKKQGIILSLEKVKKSLKDRDNLDIHRDISPLKKASDATTIVNNKTVEEAVNQMKNIVLQKEKHVRK